MEFSVRAEWNDELEREVTAALRAEVNPALEKANAAVGEEMRGALARHVREDVYAKYSPRVYERRSGGGVGAQAESAGVFSDSTRATVQFKPGGEYPGRERWHTADGDDLIGRIEKHSPEYTFLPTRRKIPDRPFWQNFTDEMVDGRMEAVFQMELRAALPEGWELEMDEGVHREDEDGRYDS